MNTVDDQINLLAQTRKNILDEVKACTTEQLFTIPEGFNNHIMWNVAHLIATLDILVYMSSSTQSQTPAGIVDRFKKGTAPDGVAMTDAEIESLLSYFIDSLDQLRQDYHHGIFGEYAERTTSYGVTLKSVDDAIFFVNLHESMHYGQIKMMKKLV